MGCDNGLCHDFEINMSVFQNRKTINTIICTKCNSGMSSGGEIQFINHIKEYYDGEIIENDRHILNGKELDIYLPELGLAFEYNGIYWHNELYKSNDYHLNKTEMCEEKGIQLIHIWEDDWIYKQEIIKSMVSYKLNNTIEKIFARKCEVREVSSIENRKFLDENHLQGFVGSKIKIGLYYNDELVSLMTFGKLRKIMNSKHNRNHFELLRFCNKLNTNVIGGASKLFKYFNRNYFYDELVSYADRSHSNGNLYIQLGFSLHHLTPPNYHYVVDGIRKYRYGYRKDILIKQGYDSNKTEHGIMLERKIYRIYNSGNFKFIFVNKKD